MANDNFTTKDILLQMREDMREINIKLDRVEIQTTKTNGRMNNAEEAIIAHGERLLTHDKKLDKINVKLAKYAGAITLIISGITFLINFLAR